MPFGELEESVFHGERKVSELRKFVIITTGDFLPFLSGLEIFS